jgi:hypothetical protein
MSKVKRIFWDIETSPCLGLFWKPGKVYINPDNIVKDPAIICICWKWEDKKRVHSLEWDHGDDGAMLEEFSDIAAEADELVAHNGDRFDLPFFQGRCLVNGLEPQPAHKTVDTCQIAKRQFRLSSNRLDYLGKVLGVGGKSRNDFQWWRDILIDNCPKAMANMVQYCKRDVSLLQQVWEKIRDYAKPKTHAGVMGHNDRWSCPHCGSEHTHTDKKRVTAAGTVTWGMQCHECHRHYTVSQKAHTDYLEAKHAPH